MDLNQRFRIHMRYLFSNLPPVSWGRLIMPLAFIGSWTLLRGFSFAPPIAFVWSAVFAQFVQIWVVLPVTVRRHRSVFGRASQATSWATCMIIGLLGIQVWWLDPMVTHRLVSFCCVSYAMLMWWGVKGDTMVRDRFVPVRQGRDLPEIFRTHLLKLYALMSVLVLAINETLVATETAFHIRVVVLSIAPICLHYTFYVLLRQTCPRLDEEDA